ncbi:DUF262 domain-containing protein [Janthinobacterium lividum]|uniref:DUF262 domain-containing HNH endonuclease family protein n=1 Tax=Janthinobacterium lividum TaxID=29581 RepID=A0ABU0XNC1_9BURK|nr:DUF262 domain-containing HNH endonuclease family protein [Janthinobacterium lividum]MDQ4625020.1 DUF262 domain-containing HNH endonuclease family protein [Janthinobacterium lividum]MDQ4673377.1 DUF262 domain-containing HNH endonuclease family protein [Janthinobacterium lividum]MDQ4684107.1 DUF262 domain-containing HNH endonuclease family protein [Janthinobacterium lividum]
MRPFSRSIIELFDGKKRYLIPLFQRQYVWREDVQLNRIWDDVRSKAELRIANRVTLPHFLGAIVICSVTTFGKQVQAFDVIDGQQRLTTFQILLCAFRDVAQNFGSEFSAELQSYIANDGVMEDKKVERYKLWPTQVDRGQLKAIVDEGSLQNLLACEASEFSQQKTGVSPNMIVAYRFFYNKIADFVKDPSIELPVEERIEALFNALKSDLALVSIELEGGDDPQVIFETLNGFSQPLLPTDLMRNYVFQKAYKEELLSRVAAAANGTLTTEERKSPEDLYAEYWLPLDHTFWKKQEKQGRFKRPRIDNFFAHFLAMKKATDVNIGRLFHEYKQWVEVSKPYASVEILLQDASHYASVYAGLVQPVPGGSFIKFSQVQSSFEVSTIIPLVLYLAGEAELPEPQLAACLDILESFLIRRAVCGLTTKNYNRLFLQIIEQIRGEEDVPAALLVALSKPGPENPSVVWPDDAMFRLNWNARPIYNELNSARIQYILLRIEAAMRTAKTEDLTINSKLTVEHIMPINWWTYWPLVGGRIGVDSLTRFASPQPDPEASARDVAVHTLGNLTLLTQALNSSVSNGPWIDKRGEILAHSALAISRSLVEVETWNEAAIEARSKRLLSHALKVWRSPQRGTATI